MLPQADDNMQNTADMPQKAYQSNLEQRAFIVTLIHLCLIAALQRSSDLWRYVPDTLLQK